MMKQIECKRKNEEDEEENEQVSISDDPVAELREIIHSKQDNPWMDDADMAMKPVVTDNLFCIFL